MASNFLVNFTACVNGACSRARAKSAGIAWGLASNLAIRKCKLKLVNLFFSHFCTA